MTSDDEADELERRIRGDSDAALDVLGESARSTFVQGVAVLAGAGGAIVGGPAGSMLGPLVAVLADTTIAGIEKLGHAKRLGATQQIEALRLLAGRVAEIEENLRAAEARGAPVPPGDVASALSMFLDAAESAADARKRAILTNPVVNAFDPELHAKAITRRLFALLERLDYPEIVLLREIEKRTRAFAGPQGSAQRGRGDDDVHRLRPWREPWSLDYSSADLLLREGLIMQIGDPRDPPAGKRAEPTDLGDALLKLARDPAPTAA